MSQAGSREGGGGEMIWGGGGGEIGRCFGVKKMTNVTLGENFWPSIKI